MMSVLFDTKKFSLAEQDLKIEILSKHNEISSLPIKTHVVEFIVVGSFIIRRDEFSAIKAPSHILSSFTFAQIHRLSFLNFLFQNGFEKQCLGFLCFSWNFKRIRERQKV